MKKIVAILVAVGLLAGVVFFIGRSGAGAPELSLTFVGFETNGAARFVVSNHSSRTIEYFGPDAGLGDGMYPHIAPILKPGEYREELVGPFKQEAKWQGVLSYERTSGFTDRLRLWLWQKHLPFAAPPDVKVTVTSGPVPPR